MFIGTGVLTLLKQALIISAVGPGACDGVGDYSAQLARHLSGWIDTAIITTDTSPGINPIDRNIQTLRLKSGWKELWKLRNTNFFYDADLAILQYVPQLYLQNKDAFWLLLWLLYFRFIRARKVAISVHEYAIPWEFSFKRILARLWMMFMMLVLGSISQVIIVTFIKRCRQLQRLLFWKKKNICIVPAGSNIPNVSDTGQVVEKKDRLTLTIFGQPSGMDERLLSAIKQWISGKQIRIIWIGRSKGEILNAWGDIEESALHIYERLPAEEVSALLSTTDIFLAPMVDGVSTRRTTIIAALAHGLPIIGTDGACTDPLLRQSPAFLLSAPEDFDQWIQNMEILVQDEAKRKVMSQTAQSFFSNFFAWEVLAEQYRKNLSVDLLKQQTTVAHCRTSWKAE